MTPAVEKLVKAAKWFMRRPADPVAYDALKSAISALEAEEREGKDGKG